MSCYKLYKDELVCLRCNVIKKVAWPLWHVERNGIFDVFEQLNSGDNIGILAFLIVFYHEQRKRSKIKSP